MKILFFIVFITILLSTCHANSSGQFNTIHLLRPRSGGAVRLAGIDCLSWRLAVEAYNLRDWRLVPASCENYVGYYMLGAQYKNDCKVVADAAVEFAESREAAGDGKDAWVFDIDETTLSNIPYYARTDVQFGAIAYNNTAFNEWVAEGTAPPIPAIRRLYEKVLSLGFKTIFLSGTNERLRDIRITNLHKAGYENWDELILRGEYDSELSAVEYKSKRRTQLVKEGYRIIGNVGDQWSDLIGENVGIRTFKVPDPLYYIG